MRSPFRTIRDGCGAQIVPFAIFYNRESDRPCGTFLCTNRTANITMIPEFLCENHLNALRFVVSTLQKHEIAYQVTGGLAGNIYGSEWPLHDIDIEVSRKDIEQVASLFQEYAIRPLSRFVDEEFDLMLLTLRVNDVEIDINQAEDAFVFTKDGRRVKLDTDLCKAIEKTFLGSRVWVQPLEDIIRYKELLSRSEDVRDLRGLR